VADNNQWRQVGKYLGLAFLLPSCTLVGLAIGYFLDKAFGTHFLTFTFLLLGIAAGIIELLRELKSDQ